MTDLTMGTIGAALSGLAARQRIIAENIANVGTPGYKAGRVDFESSLRSAVGGGDLSGYSMATSTSTEATNFNENNVNLDEEIMSLTETNLKYQLMTEAMNSQFHILNVSMQRNI